MSFVVARDLRKRYGKSHGGRAQLLAVDGVSFEIARGETLAVVGESGAGKSTLARLVMRLIEPDSGSIFLDGEDLTSKRGKLLRRYRNRMQMIFQDPYSSLDPKMTIADSVAEPLILHESLSRTHRNRRVEDLLHSVGIRRDQLDRYPDELSGGQLQGVAIARAIATNPQFIVCDEPVSALDLSIRAQVLNILRDIQRERSISCLFITHDLSLVGAVADRVVVMREGRIVEEGTVEGIFSSPTHPYTTELLEAIPHPDPRRRRLRTPIGKRAAQPSHTLGKQTAGDEDAQSREPHRSSVR